MPRNRHRDRHPVTEAVVGVIRPAAGAASPPRAAPPGVPTRTRAGRLDPVAEDHAVLVHLGDDLDRGTLGDDGLRERRAGRDARRRLFGKEIGQLVDGVTKLSRLELQSDHTKQAENFRKLVLAMSEDIRVLLVKLADRLHNMRTLHFIKDPEKRRRIARETMEIYAPLAERIGMHADEGRAGGPRLRASSIRRRAQSIVAAPAASCASRAATSSTQIIERAAEALLTEAGVKCIGVRPREVALLDLAQDAAQERRRSSSSPTSWRSASSSTTSTDCYQALGVIHSAYPMIPGRFKDYISTPKPNGYRSLHTGVIGPQRQRIEVQIRTREMHEVAELGVAAHWVYKQGRPAQIDGQAIPLAARAARHPGARLRARRNSSSTPSSRCSRTRCSASRPRAT